MKRYNFALPEELYNELQAIADKQSVSVVDVIRQFIKLGLFVNKLSQTSKLLVRENNVDKEVILI